MWYNFEMHAHEQDNRIIQHFRPSFDEQRFREGRIKHAENKLGFASVQ